MSDRTIRIGCASGFWGDSSISTPQLLAGGKLDYLVFDYLAEITMSIMARARAKDPKTGYAHDFVTMVMKRALPEIAKQKVRVVANAGGVNPVACGEALEEVIRELGLDLKVATVTGDDLIDRIEDLRARDVREMYSGQPLPGGIMSVNAYLGAFPVAEALAAGADIVITGRCVDSAVALGPCIHEFGWHRNDYDQLAGGSLAGHIIECGAQATGGLFTDWRDSKQWENIGYPVVEVRADGSFTTSKPPNTGGLVTPATVSEQLVYEIGDPQAYILPDVVCDFSGVKIRQTAENEVEVTGARGSGPTPTYKVSATYMDGWRLTALVTIGGIEARDKAIKTAEAVLRRCAGILKVMNAEPYTETNVEVLGTEWTYGTHSRAREAREVILKISARHPEEKALSVLLRELTSAGTSMAPGTSGVGGSRAKPGPVVRLFSFLIPKGEVKASVHFGGASREVEVPRGKPFQPGEIRRPDIISTLVSEGRVVKVPLIRLAWGRSGDKGDKANIGIIARKPDYLPWIRATLTPESVKEYLGHLVAGSVERFELPGIHALNFLLHEALGGGGIASLRTDPQGKALAQMLMDYKIPIPEDLARRDQLS